MFENNENRRRCMERSALRRFRNRHINGVQMPQSERSQIMKEMLRWLDAKSKSGAGASRSQIINHIVVDITELGCTKARAQGYLKTAISLGFISLHRLKYKTTPICKNWLQIHTE